MLVCNVSLLRRRAAIVADIAEAAAASDAATQGHVVFATLVDDPANVRDRVDAYLGEIMLEAATAASTVNAGLVYAATVAEGVTATDTATWFVPTAGTVTEAAAAADTPNASVISGATYATLDPATVSSVTLSGGNLVATNTGTTSTNQGARVATSSGKATGKYYFEATWTTINSSTASNVGIGVGTTASTYIGMGNGGTTGVHLYSSGSAYSNGSSILSWNSWLVGSKIAIAVDLTNRKLWYRDAVVGVNWNNSGTANPATNVGGLTIPAGTMVPFCTWGGTGGVAGDTFTVNFGASAFSGAVPSGFTAGWPS